MGKSGCPYNPNESQSYSYHSSILFTLRYKLKKVPKSTESRLYTDKSMSIREAKISPSFIHLFLKIDVSQ